MVYSMRNALVGSTFAARPAGTALAKSATSATPAIAPRVLLLRRLSI